MEEKAYKRFASRVRKVTFANKYQLGELNLRTAQLKNVSSMFRIRFRIL